MENPLETDESLEDNQFFCSSFVEKFDCIDKYVIEKIKFSDFINYALTLNIYNLSNFLKKKKISRNLITYWLFLLLNNVKQLQFKQLQKKFFRILITYCFFLLLNNKMLPSSAFPR